MAAWNIWVKERWSRGTPLTSPESSATEISLSSTWSRKLVVFDPQRYLMAGHKPLRAFGSPMFRVQSIQVSHNVYAITESPSLTKIHAF